MSYSENKEEINKVFQINSLNSRGRFFLKTQDYERAKECFEGVLEVDEENMEALMSLLTIERDFKSIDQAVDYYQNLYTSQESETVEACEYETALIEQFKEEYFIDGYFSKEEIGELFDYKEDITFESKLPGCEKQKELIEEEIKNNPYLSRLAKSEDPQAKEIIERILEPYNSRLEEAKNTDQYARIKIATNYRRFIEKQSEEVRELAKKAQERKENDFNGAIELYYQSEDIDDYERAIEIFKSFAGYKDADEYIKNCRAKIEDIKARQKAIENQNKVRDYLNQASECLKNGEYEKADELYFEVISIDSDNPDGYLGTLLAENQVSSKEDLSDVFFKTDYTPIKVKALDESADTVEKYVDKYYLPYYLEKEEIRKFFSYNDFYYESHLQSASEKKDELKREFEHNQTISWLMEHEDVFINDLYRELNGKYDQQIEEFKKKDELEAVNKSVKYQRFLKNSAREVKQKYEDAVKKKEEDYQNARDILHTSKSVKEVKEIKKTLNNLGDYKDSKDLLFEALNKIEELKIIEKEEEFRKELAGYIEEAKEYLKEEKFEDADLLFQRVYSFDDENIEARVGLLMVENNCHNIDELIEKYKEFYSTEQFEDDCDLINGKSLIEGHIQAMADRYSVPGRLERNVIVNLYNNEEIYYKSIVSKLEELQETVNDDISIDENLTWLCEHENNQIFIFFKELNEDLQEAIKNAKKEDIVNQKKIREEFKSYAKEIDQAVIDLYKRIRKPDEDEREFVEPEEEPTTLDELAELHNLNLEVEPLEIPSEEEEIKEDKKLKFNILNLFNKLKENKEQEEEKKLAEEQERIRVEEAMRARLTLEIHEEFENKQKEKAVKEEAKTIKSEVEQPEKQEEIVEPVVEQPKKKEETKSKYKEPKPFVIQRPKPVIEEKEPEPEIIQPESAKEEIQPEEITPVKAEKPKKQKKEKVQGEPSNNKILFIMGAVIIAMSALVINIAYRTVIKPNKLYNEALELVEAQQYNKAIEIFEQLGDYKDSAELINDTYYKKAMSLYEKDNPVGALNVLKNINTTESKNKIKEIKNELISKAKIGDVVILGEYEQDGISENGKEVIEWVVINIDEEGRMLLLSKYGLDGQKYNNTSEEVFWDESSLRFWLNHRFRDNAFANEDISLLQTAKLNNTRYDEYGDIEEYETEDTFFLLSSQEVEEYLDAQLKICRASDNLLSNLAISNTNGNCGWWLRSVPQKRNKTTEIVNEQGEIKDSMYEITKVVRPAMYIKP